VSVAKKWSSRPDPTRVEIPLRYIAPQLCELVTAPPVGDRWVHEAKLDGYRAQLHISADKAILYSRKDLNWTHRFPEIARSAEALGDCIIDGEAFAVWDGLPSFAGHTDALAAKSTFGLSYYAFGTTAGSNENLMGWPLHARKDALRSAISHLRPSDNKRFSYVDHHVGEGLAMYEAACKIGLEGFVSKIINAPYKLGDRSGLWTKAKCRAIQELVVAGWKITGAAFRSLVVGTFRDGKFVHVRTVGTGYDSHNLPGLLKALKFRFSDRRPFDHPRGPKDAKDVHWIKPTLVIEAEVASWTGGSRIRQACFKGLREDKSPKNAIVETPAPAPKT
jgi:bifunctional non-homologous end joining protein LigD